MTAKNYPTGSRHYRWGAGRKISGDGYVKVRVGQDHPLSDRNGWTYEHLLVWTSAGRPRPERGQLLHHENEDKADNRLSNLRLLSRADHNRLHNAERGRGSDGRLLPKPPVR